MSISGNPTKETLKFTLTAGCEFPWLRALTNTRLAQSVYFSHMVCAWRCLTVDAVCIFLGRTEVDTSSHTSSCLALILGNALSDLMPVFSGQLYFDQLMVGT